MGDVTCQSAGLTKPLVKARKLKALLSGEENGSAYLKLRSKRQEFKELRAGIAREKQESDQASDEIEDIKNELAAIKQENEQIKKALRTAEDPAEISEHEERKRRLEQQRSRLRKELRATKEEKRAEKDAHKTFEEAIGLQKHAQAGKARPPGKEGENSIRPGTVDLDDDSEYISRSVYVDQLLRWSEFFPREQLLVLKSEEIFESPQETLKRVLEFLGLPEWEPKPPKLETKRNAGGFEGVMDSATRRRLEEYFEPYNRRLYDYLGVDFGW